VATAVGEDGTDGGADNPESNEQDDDEQFHGVSLG
jgi:hypothetical protein